MVGWPGNEAKQCWWLDGLGMRLCWWLNGLSKLHPQTLQEAVLQLAGHNHGLPPLLDDRELHLAVLGVINTVL